MFDQGRPWTLEEAQILRELVFARVEPGIIALKMKRSEEDVRRKASAIGLSIAPGFFFTEEVPTSPFQLSGLS